MYFALLEVADGVINQAMPGDGVLAGKNIGDDGQRVMAAFLGPGMAGMERRLVFDGQRLRLQDSQPAAQQLDTVPAQAGNTFLKGLTLTRA